MPQKPKTSQFLESKLSLNTGRILIGAAVISAGSGVVSNPTFWNIAPSISQFLTAAILISGIMILIGSFVNEWLSDNFEIFLLSYLGLIVSAFCIHLHLLAFDDFLGSAFLYFALISPWYFTKQNHLVVYQVSLIVCLVFTILVTPEANPEATYYLYRFGAANLIVFLIANSRILSLSKLISQNQDSIDFKNNLNEGLIQTDRNFIMTYVNPKLGEMIGQNSEDYIGRFVLTEVIPTESRAEQAKRLLEATPDNTSRYFLHLLHSDGHKVPVQISVSPRKDRKTGRLAGFNILLVNIYDHIEQLRILEEDLKVMEQKVRDNEAKRVELERFARSIAYDLRAPLEVINRGIQILFSLKESYDPMAAQYMEEMEIGIGNVYDIMQSVLIYSITDTQQMKITKVDLIAAMSEVRTSLEPLILANTATILYDNLPTINGDRIQLLRLFRNFIENAISRRSEEDPRIQFSFTLNQEKKEYIFSVQDNGTGISREDYENIFRIFQEGDTPHQVEGDSFGFSLSVCNKIVQNHGGKLWFTSNAGKGTTFHFSLPLEQKEKEIIPVSET
ncbi:MAG: ATP-binding protein [Bacteroidia bacterium]